MESLPPLEAIYSDKFFAKRGHIRPQMEPLADAIVATVSPRTAIDVGCANGYLMESLARRGVTVRGIEGSRACLKYLVVDPNLVLIADLRKPIAEPVGVYELAVSLEVGEHIEEEYADQYLDTLCMLSNFILMTAAPPGQRGTHHVNCQPQEYWVQKMLRRGYRRLPEAEMTYRQALESWKENKHMDAYYRNVMCFKC